MEFFRCLLIIGERLQVGALLHRRVDKHVHIRRRGKLRILIAQLVADLSVKAQDSHERCNGRIDIILSIELEQPSLR